MNPSFGKIVTAIIMVVAYFLTWNYAIDIISTPTPMYVIIPILIAEVALGVFMGRTLYKIFNNNN